jgi:transposase-like protein
MIALFFSYLYKAIFIYINMEQIYEIKKKKQRKKSKKSFKRYIKRGFCQKTGKQRWYDKLEKRFFFKEYSKVGYSNQRKNKAIALAKEGNSFRAIGRLLKISHTCVYYWVRSFCESLQKPDFPAGCDAMELDEMWHFCQKKSKKSGSGLQ